jgi:pimeloyl-ACP methyl ester carboxylesterase
MNNYFLIVIISAAMPVVLWLISFIFEALRRAPQTPVKLLWAPEIPVSYIDIDGTRIRYVKAGQGPTLLLLHTLRTQLDLFEKVIPELLNHFTVYAPDYPGHGYSDIPEAVYDADFFAHFVERFLKVMDLRDVTLCGVSIGGAISLILAGRQNPRVGRVLAINPYDYAKGRGMARSSLLGAMITYTALVPFLGQTVMRLRNFIIMKTVLNGGVANSENIPLVLMKEMNDVGNRPGHYRAFSRLLRNSESWQSATEIYRNIQIPVHLMWGAQDWSKMSEREHDRELIPGAQVVTIENGGHFLPLDRPDAIIEYLQKVVQQ